MNLLSALPFKKMLDMFHGDPMKKLQRKIFSEVRRGRLANDDGFPESISLPDKFGLFLPERVIELVLAWLTYRKGAKVLDVGFSNSMECHLRTISSLPTPRRFTGLDIARPTYDPHPYYAHAVLGSLVRAPFVPAAFDLIWCISTLEHIGMDNSGYRVKTSAAKEVDAEAIGNMVRLLRPNGSALITVPYGKYEDHTWFRNYDSEHWQTLLSIARPSAQVKEWYFRHSAVEGWRTASPGELVDTGYRDENNFGAAGLAAALLIRDS